MRVTNSNANAAGPLVVAGYNVSGSVRSDGEPMKGVKFLLFSSLVNKEVSIQRERARVRRGAGAGLPLPGAVGVGFSRDGSMGPWRGRCSGSGEVHTVSGSNGHPCPVASWAHHFPFLAGFLVIGRSLPFFP